MDLLARLLFHELADLAPAEREKIFTDRDVGPQLRAEVESLLSFDADSSSSLTSCVSDIAAEMLRSGDARQFSHCGPYRLVRILGEGGMGAVYLAERSDGEIQQNVAIKLLRAGADRPAWRERFLRERQLLASFNHPAIARVIDAGHDAAGRPYLVMEYVDGVPIDIWAANTDLPGKLALFLRACDGVSHAHRHLIIHRDLKPSNILVDASGQPKLLDFGIAKLLDETGEATQTVERLLTPNYASPEQLSGAPQTTSTDIYSLGAVLFKLLTRRSPHESGVQASQTAAHLPSDIGYILRKALRHEPEERYATVDALAGDVRAFLECRPVQARSGDAWYRTRKFLRRYWLPVAATIVTVTGLSLGLFAANHERIIAQRRFLQVRSLAGKVLALDEVIRGLPGSIQARREIVAMSKEYLEALAAEGQTGQDLALETGIAYARLAQSQGVPPDSNLGQYAEAEQSLKKADTLVESVLIASPQNRKALLTSAEISHDRMILTDADRRRDESVALARKAAGRLETLLSLGKPTEIELKRAGTLFSNIALANKNAHHLDDTIRFSRRSVEIFKSVGDTAHIGSPLSVLADAMRFSGDLDGALQAVREARHDLEMATFTKAVDRRSQLSAVLWRKGVILGQDGGISLDQPDQALASLRQSHDVAEQWAREDPTDAGARILVSQAAYEMGKILSHRDPRRALAVFDHGLLRLGEIRNNVKARRDEVRLLAGSSYTLRSLNRTRESKDRIDAAFQRLRDTKMYPASAIDPEGPVEVALRALGDHHAATGEPLRAAEVYQELLDKLTVSKEDARGDLRYAVKLSHVYEALAALHRRNGQRNRAETLSSLRLELWRNWDAKLPGNSFVRRQLETTASLK